MIRPKRYLELGAIALIIVSVLKIVVFVAVEAKTKRALDRYAVATYGWERAGWADR